MRLGGVYWNGGSPEKKLKQKVKADGEALVQMQTVGFNPSVTDSANANRISKEERLVSLERQVSTGKKLVALPAAINASARPCRLLNC